MQFPDFRLTDKVAVVTGASRGLGEGTALALANAGAHVVVTSRVQDRVEPVAAAIEEMGREALPLALEVRQVDSIEAMVEAAMARFGRIDVLVNNAGGSTVGRGTPFFELSLEDWQYTIDVDLTGTFLCARAAARNMVERKQGAIINVASVFSYATATGNASYTAAKGAVVQLTKAMAADLAPHQVRVNCIAPGAIVVEEDRKVRGTLMGDYLLVERWGRAEDIAAAALFLASGESSYIDGQTITVDGGLLALMPGKPLGQS